MKRPNNRWAIVNRMFLDNFMVAALIELSYVGAGLIDGIVVSRMLPDGAMAAFGVAQPIFSIIAIFSGLFAIGMQTVASQALGDGRIDDCNRVFCAAVYIAGLFSLLSLLLVYFTSGPIAVLLAGKDGGDSLTEGVAAYTRGLALGIPAIILNTILSPAIQMDSGRKRVLVSVIVDFVCDSLFNLLAVYLGMGLFGIGLATSCGRYIRLGVLLFHFRDQSHLLHFVPLKTSVKEFIHLLSMGTEKAWRRLGNVIRPIVINKMVLLAGGTMAMTAMSVRGNVSDVTEVLAVGLADTVGLLAGIYYGEKNMEAERALGKSAHRSTFIFCISVAILLILLSGPIAGFYTGDHTETTALTRFALIGVALQCPLQALIRSRISYLQRIQKSMNMKLLILVATAVYPILSALILDALFGIYGILLCYTVSDLLSLVTVWGYYAVKKKKGIPSVQDYLNLPDDFLVNPGDVISLDIRNLEDVSLGAEQIELFCRGHKIDWKTGNRVSVCFEEMASNTVKHGFPLNCSKAPIIDLLVVYSPDKLMIRLQDNCPKFDVGARIKAMANSKMENPDSEIGTRLTVKLADSVKYAYCYETNIVFLDFLLDARDQPGEAPA